MSARTPHQRRQVAPLVNKRQAHHARLACISGDLVGERRQVLPRRPLLDGARLHDAQAQLAMSHTAAPDRLAAAARGGGEGGGGKAGEGGPGRGVGCEGSDTPPAASGHSGAAFLHPSSSCEQRCRCDAARSGTPRPAVGGGWRPDGGPRGGTEALGRQHGQCIAWCVHDMLIRICLQALGRQHGQRTDPHDQGARALTLEAVRALRERLHL